MGDCAGMNLELDPDVRALAEFMQRSFPAAKLVAMSAAVADLAPLLWGRYGNEAVAPLALRTAILPRTAAPTSCSSPNHLLGEGCCMTPKPPSFCCQRCGSCVGWIGRLLQIVGVSPHQCPGAHSTNRAYVKKTYVNMTPEQAELFDHAFDKMDAAFKEMDRAFKATRG